MNAEQAGIKWKTIQGFFKIKLELQNPFINIYIYISSIFQAEKSSVTRSGRFFFIGWQNQTIEHLENVCLWIKKSSIWSLHKISIQTLFHIFGPSVSTKSLQWKQQRNLPNLFADKSSLTWSTGLLYLGTNVYVSEEVDGPTHHVFTKWWFADWYMRVDRWLSEIRGEIIQKLLGTPWKIAQIWCSISISKL